jgi:hypothetical protein
MKENTEQRFKLLVKSLEKDFDEGLDLQTILFLIGVQELGKGFKKYSKNEKMDLMHIAVCRILQAFGYYALDHIDEDGWPHYRLCKNLPKLNKGEQDEFMKSAVLRYFEENALYNV